jgi:cyclohexanone monooxygenase
VAFLRLLEKWRKDGDLAGLELSYDQAMESAPSSG